MEDIHTQIHAHNHCQLQYSIPIPIPNQPMNHWIQWDNCYAHNILSSDGSSIGIGIVDSYSCFATSNCSASRSLHPQPWHDNRKMVLYILILAEKGGISLFLMYKSRQNWFFPCSIPTKSFHRVCLPPQPLNCFNTASGSSYTIISSLLRSTLCRAVLWLWLYCTVPLYT